jgi:NAD(P)-dependent dehydrogenase (short-subunit alcohol dehydrogenase family)
MELTAFKDCISKMSAVLRSVLITGASSGIGAAVARRLAAPGVGLLLHARKNREGLEAVAAEARQKGAETDLAIADLLDPAVPAALVEAALARFGALDVVVSNAGAANRAQWGVADLGDLQQASAVIETAFFQLMTAALPALKQARDGRVVAISSFVAHVYRPDVTLFPVSAAAKAGLEAMVRSLAVTLAPQRVTVNCVSPGFTRKESTGHSALSADQWRAVIERIPIGRLGEPDEVAAAVAYLTSKEAGYVTGQTLHVNGGLSITP